MASPLDRHIPGATGRDEDTSRWGMLDLLLLGLALAVFLCLACWQLDLPGLHYDEAKEAGNNALQLLRGLPMQAFRGASVRVLGLGLPLMVQDYIGALNVYLSIPFMALLGVNVPALRLMPVLVGAVTIALVYGLARVAYDRMAAAVAALLLAASPTFVFWSRQGIFVTNVAGALAVASALTALRWSRSGRSSYLWLTMFLWGLGVYAKILFIWVIGATVTLWLAWRVLLLLRRRRAALSSGRVPADKDDLAPVPAGLLRPWKLLVAVVCFVAPLTPLLLFNLRTGGTLSSVLANAGSSYYGVSNADFAANAARRLGQVVTLLRGDHFWYLGDRLANPAAPWIAAGLVIAFVAALAVSRPRTPFRSSWVAALGPLLYCLLLVLQSSFTVSDLFITHYAILVPFVFLAVGAIAAWLARRKPLLSLLPVMVALICWSVGDLRATIQYHGALAATGGHGAHSDAIQDLADHLDAAGHETPLALDWGIAAPVYFLTSGRVRPLEIFGYERLDAPDEAFDAALRSSLRDRSAAYLFHVPEDVVFAGRRERFDELLAEAGLAPRIEAVFHERSGHMLFVVTRSE